MKNFFRNNQNLTLYILIVMVLGIGAFIMVCLIKLFFYMLLLTFQYPFIASGIISTLFIILNLTPNQIKKIIKK